MDRDRPVLFGDERSMLLSWLNWHRQCLEQKCAELDPEQLVLRSVPPSALSLLGLVRHMIQMELTRLHWYHDGPSELPFGEHDFDEVTDADPRETLERWRTVIRRSDEIVSGQPRLEVAGALGTDLRFNLLSLINEYARHNGHADLLRESIDGQTGE
jgi:hypothetical protein